MNSKQLFGAVLFTLVFGASQALAAQDPAAAPPAAASEAATEATAAAPAEAAAPAATAEAAPAATAETGRIIFFRPKKMMGAAISFKIREGEAVLGKLSNGSFFAVDVPVGVHEYYAKSEGRDDALVLEVEPGETYYVLGNLAFGVMAGNGNLSPSDQAMFDELNKKKLKDRTGEKVD